VTGFIVRWKVFDPPTRDQMYDDEDFWEVPEEDVEAQHAYNTTIEEKDDKL